DSGWLLVLSRHLVLFNAPPPTAIYTLSLHDALPISSGPGSCARDGWRGKPGSITPGTTSTRSRIWPRESPFLFGTRTMPGWTPRSEEHTSELQSRFDLVCRLLLEKKKMHHTV